MTLAFGESVDLPILSGTVAVQADGLPTSWEGHDYWSTSVALVREGDQLALYAVGDTAHGLLTPTWSTSEPIASDTGLVRFVQGWNSGGIVYIRLPGEPRSGLPELCYFDAGNVSDYFARAAGAFDAIVQKKFAQPAEMARLRWFAEPGRAHTYVFVGDGPTMRWLAFRDR